MRTKKRANYISFAAEQRGAPFFLPFLLLRLLTLVSSPSLSPRKPKKQIDNRHEDLPILTPEQAAKICDRNFGIGGDGVIFALPPLAPQASASATEAAAKAGGSTLDYAMRIYNSDGSEPEMCGNGIRCLARFVADVDGKKENGKSSLTSSSSNSTAAVATGAGIIRPEVLSDGMIRVDMGPPTLAPALVPTTLASSTGNAAPAFKSMKVEAVVKAEVQSGGETWLVTCVSMGNPHAVTFGKVDGSLIEDVDAVDLAGPGAEMVPFYLFSPLFFFSSRPRRKNSSHFFSPFPSLLSIENQNRRSPPSSRPRQTSSSCRSSAPRTARCASGSEGRARRWLAAPERALRSSPECWREGSRENAASICPEVLFSSSGLLRKAWKVGVSEGRCL